jgi:nicotinate-nucleotide adenylyltransferase
MRIGIYGGSFDPVHLGHLIAAESAREQASLDRVIFVPAAQSPHKTYRTPAAAADRLAMLELATSGHPAFEVSSVELERGGISYTVETLAEMRARFPDDQLVLLLGPDAVRGLATWRGPRRIAELAELVTISRSGLDDDDQLRNDATLRELLGATVLERCLDSCVRMPAVGVRATAIREAVRAGRSIRYLVPAAVATFIQQHGLYRDATADAHG